MMNEEINTFLKNFKIKAECNEILDNSLSRIYNFSLLPGAKVKDLEKYRSEITMFLKEFSEPTITVVYSSNQIRFEYLKIDRPTINLFNCDVKNKSQDLNLFLGKDLSYNNVTLNLQEAPHALIAGTTGSGKSTLLNVIIANLIGNGVQTYIIDLKGIDFFEYSKFSNIKLSFSYEEALNVIKSLSDYMDTMYKLIFSGSIANRNTIQPVTLIIDEFADLIMQDTSGKLNQYLLKLIQKCRAVNIHVILATQRPSADIITGSIKANVPVRIACRTASAINSRIILDESGAERLVGKGDALIKDSHGKVTRFQSAYVSNTDVLNRFKSW